MNDGLVPVQEIIRLLAPHGIRLPKRPAHVLPVIPPSRWLPGIYRGKPDRWDDGHWHRGDNLQKGEYRDWVGSDWKESDRVVCRACMQIFYAKDERKKHHKENNCTVMISNAFRILRKDKACVVCDAKTTQTTWGVPVCSPGCREKFKLFNPKSVQQTVEMLARAGTKR